MAGIGFERIWRRVRPFCSKREPLAFSTITATVCAIVLFAHGEHAVCVGINEHGGDGAGFRAPQVPPFLLELLTLFGFFIPSFSTE